MKDLKQRTIRGGLARLCAQGANFFLRLGSLVVLARLLGPKDFGLVGMVTAFTGILTLFRDFGLSSAAIQRTHVSDEQISTLFWINIFVGMLLGLLAVVGAPIIAAFYHEPRLVGVTAVLALGFLFNAAGVQHSVLLQRQMRFTALAVINTVGLIAGTAVGIGGARAGYGYWALVGMTLTIPLISTVGFWLTTAWVPGKPHRQTGIRSMLRFGGTVTLNGLVSYLANNVEKVLLGRFWGVDALGIYGRAYQLVNIPTDNLNFAAGEVAFSALSRLQDDPIRLKRYFLTGYSVVLALTLPMTIACALFADDVILVVLGPKWSAAVPLFRLLAPTILVFAIVNPLFWLLSSLGLVERSLKMGLVIAPLMILSYVVDCTRYSDFRPRYVTHRESSVGIQLGGRNLCFRSSALLRSVVPFASSYVGELRPPNYVRWNALVRYRAEGGLLRSSPWIKGTYTWQGRANLGIGLSNHRGIGPEALGTLKARPIQRVFLLDLLTSVKSAYREQIL